MEGWDIHWKKPASTSLVSVSKVYEINLLTYLLTYLLTKIGKATQTIKYAVISL